jgi:hypothetical protein
MSIIVKRKFSTSKYFSNGKFVSANHILRNFLSAENFPEWKWTLYSAFAIDCNICVYSLTKSNLVPRLFPLFEEGKSLGTKLNQIYEINQLICLVLLHPSSLMTEPSFTFAIHHHANAFQI